MELVTLLVPALSALFGTAIGATASIYTQRHNARALARGELRKEFIDTCRRFLTQAKKIERLAERRWRDEDIGGLECATETTALWQAQAELLLICDDDEIDQKAHAQTEAATHLAWNKEADPPWDTIPALNRNTILAMRRRLSTFR